MSLTLIATCYRYNYVTAVQTSSLQLWDAETLAVQGNYPAPTDNFGTFGTIPANLHGIGRPGDTGPLYVTSDNQPTSSGGVSTQYPALHTFDLAARAWTSRIYLSPPSGKTWNTSRITVDTRGSVFPPLGGTFWLPYSNNATSGTEYYYQEYLIGTSSVTLGRVFLDGILSSTAGVAVTSPVPSSVGPSYGTDFSLGRRAVFSPDGTKAYCLVTAQSPDVSTANIQCVAEVNTSTLATTRLLYCRLTSGGALLNARSLDISGDGTHLYVGSPGTSTSSAALVNDIDLSTGLTAGNYAVATGTVNQSSYPALAVVPTVTPGSMEGVFGFTATVSAQVHTFLGGIKPHAGGTATALTDRGAGNPNDSVFYAQGYTGASRIGGFLVEVQKDSSTLNATGDVVFVTASSGAVVQTVAGPQTPQTLLLVTLPGTGGTATAGQGYDQDAYGRPAFVTADSGGVSLWTTDDGGHTFSSHGVTAAAAADASLWYDPRTNQPTAFYGDGVSVVYGNKATGSGENGDWAGSVSLTGVSAKSPVVAAHRQDFGRLVLVGVSGTTLSAFASYSGGDAASWSALGTVATGVDFTATGRAGLCFLGGSLVCVYGSGNNLLAKTSADGGATWGSAVTVATAGPYTGISCRAHQGFGAVFLEAATGTGPYTARLWASGDVGATWALSSGTPPAPTSVGTALGVIEQTGRLLAGTVDYSDDAGLTWSPD